MDTETSSFETSEMLASALASTPLLHDAWILCEVSNANQQSGFAMDLVGDVGYVAFSGGELASVFRSWGGRLAPLDSGGSLGLFSPLRCQGEEGGDPVMVHDGFLHQFRTLYGNQTFQQQMSSMMEKSRSIIITGHSIGGAIASLCALWLLCHLQTSSHVSILCITFGSPLLGNESLSRAILRERWGGNFCHLISKYDIVPRLFFAPLSPQLHSLIQHGSFSGIDTSFDNTKSAIFGSVLSSLEELERSGNGVMTSLLWPFGNYLFCSLEGGVCLQNAASVVRMLHLLFKMGSPDCCFEDHLKYGEHVRIMSSQFLMRRSSLQGELPESSYEASVALALQSSGIAFQEEIARPAKDCLNAARQMGRTPNLNCAKLAIRLAKITPYREEIQWYKACSERTEDQMGYYDSFKKRGASIRDSKVNMNRHKLATFWDSVIKMLDTNQLPHDFNWRAKWVNASHFYKLLVEPLDIAEYYRNNMHLSDGHYMSNGRQRRYQIFDKWWNDRPVKEEQKTRSRFASLTQDSCFWAKVEEAKDWLDTVKLERDQRELVLLWRNIERFASYASELVERKEVSKDVIARNSSYTMWVNDYNKLRSQWLMVDVHQQFRV